MNKYIYIIYKDDGTELTRFTSELEMKKFFREQKRKYKFVKVRI